MSDKKMDKVDSASDYVYIMEQSQPMQRVDTPGEGQVKQYVYQGVAAVFGIENNNKRVYEKGEYLPHLEYLNEKITKKRLVGELDHPAGFDISLQNISHVVEKLWYDPSDETVKIKVRLVDTPKGRIAMTLADAGVPLAISSRSAGQVLSEGRVKLHRIFTFDLVAEPGFSQAILSPSTMNESISSNYKMLCDNFSCIKESSIINDLTDVSESFGFPENTKIYKVNGDDTELQSILSKDDLGLKENKDNKDMGYVTTNELADFSKDLKKMFTEQIGTLQEQITGINGIISKVQEAKDDDDAVDETPAVATEDPISDDPTDTADVDLGDASQESTDLVETPDGGETTLEDIGEEDDKDEVIKKLTSYVNYMQKQMNALIMYVGYIGDTMNKEINYSESLGAFSNGLANYMNYMGNKVNVSYNFLDVLSKTVNEGLNHNDHIAHVVNKMHNFMHDELVEKMNVFGEYANYIGEQTEKHIHFSSYLKDVVNGKKIGSKINLKDRDLGSVGRIVEGAEALIESDDNIHSRVDGLLSKIQSTTRDAVLENRYPFLKLIDKDNRQKFYDMDKETKEAIVATMESAVYTTAQDVYSLMNQAVLEKQNQLPKYLAYMPQKYKDLYENMNESEKSYLSMRARNYKNMNTPYQVKTFWDTHDFNGVKDRLVSEKHAIETQKLYESQSKEGYVPIKAVQDSRRGYSDAYIQKIANRANR